MSNDNTKRIPLTKGQFALVDKEDFEELNKHKWYTSIWGYAIRNATIAVGKRKTTRMHRVIAGCRK
mgnify:CR=1 FL=1